MKQRREGISGPAILGERLVYLFASDWMPWNGIRSTMGGAFGARKQIYKAFTENGCKRPQSRQGFTLLEILIALFIFSIISVILVTDLRTVIDAQSGTEVKSQRLRQLQMALLILSREVEQTVDRPVINSSGKEEAAFVGNRSGFTFTHTGLADAPGAQALSVVKRSSLQRSEYMFNENQLLRLTWPVLDQAPETKPHARALLDGVVEGRFEYLGDDGHFSEDWPVEGGPVLPRAIRMYATFAHWGKIGQIYFIPTQDQPATSPPGNADATKSNLPPKP